MREYRVLCADGEVCPRGLGVEETEQAKDAVAYANRWCPRKKAPHRAEVREVRPWKEIP